MDRDGGYVTLNGLIFQKPYLLIGAYVPPPYSTAVIREILECHAFGLAILIALGTAP